MPLPVQTSCWNHYATWIQKPPWLRFFAWAPPFYSLHYSLFTIRHSVRERFAITGISPGFLFLPRVDFSWQQKTPEAVDATSGATYGSWVLELKTKPARLTVLFVIVCCGYLSKEWVYSWGVSPGRPLREPKAFIAEISPLSSMKWMKMKPARVSIFLDSLCAQKGYLAPCLSRKNLS